MDLCSGESIGILTRNWPHTASSFAANTLMQKRPEARTLGQVVKFAAGQRRTSSGSRETDVNELQAMPTGP